GVRHGNENSAQRNRDVGPGLETHQDTGGGVDGRAAHVPAWGTNRLGRPARGRPGHPGNPPGPDRQDPKGGGSNMNCPRSGRAGAYQPMHGPIECAWGGCENYNERHAEATREAEERARPLRTVKGRDLDPTEVDQLRIKVSQALSHLPPVGYQARSVAAPLNPPRMIPLGQSLRTGQIVQVREDVTSDAWRDLVWDHLFSQVIPYFRNPANTVHRSQALGTLEAMIQESREWLGLLRLTVLQWVDVGPYQIPRHLGAQMIEDWDSDLYPD